MRGEKQNAKAKVRYINAWWKDDKESPRIGSREARRANTSFHEVQMHNFDRIETSEVLVMKQMDPRPRRSTYCPHTSFDDPTAKQDALPRRSIEMQWLAVVG